MVIDRELLSEPDWAEWYLLTPAQRWIISGELLQKYIAEGGSLDPDPDPSDPLSEFLIDAARKPCKSVKPPTFADWKLANPDRDPSKL